MSVNERHGDSEHRADIKKRQFYLGVDGGGTKTKFTVCRIAPGDESRGTATPHAPAADATCDTAAPPWGTIAGEYTSTCCHYLQIGFDGLENLMREGIAAVCEQVRQNPDAGAPDFSPADIRHAFFGLAGYADIITDDPKIDAAVRRAVDGLAPFPYRMGNDCENALAGALAGAPGINIIAGTGSVGCGRDQHGGYYRCGGWNHALGGDEGSAYWIALRLLHSFQRQSDGRDEKTALYQAVIDALSLPSDDAMVTRIVGDWNMDRTRIASLSPIVSKLAAAGDPRAKEILAEAARELTDCAIAIKARLDFSGDVPVSGTGGIFRIGPDLIDPFDRILHQHGMHYVPPLYEPDLGSVLLAARDYE
ncbi:MAG: ATPase [Firmicutes bacterium]|nr:ATPase [Bacillota bacterium]